MKEIEFKSPVGLYRFTPEPGEVFVLKIVGRITPEINDRIREMWDQQCPGVPLMVMDELCQLGVMKP